MLSDTKLVWRLPSQKKGTWNRVDTRGEAAALGWESEGTQRDERLLRATRGCEILKRFKNEEMSIQDQPCQDAPQRQVVEPLINSVSCNQNYPSLSHKRAKEV